MLALSCGREGDGEADAGLGGEGRGAPDGAILEACDPGTTRCKDLDTQETCNPDGYGWVASRCLGPEGEQRSCVDGACVERVCATPGAFERCLDPKTQLVCSDDGTALLEVPCDGVCTDDQGCREPVCRPGFRRCGRDEILEECDRDGLGWVAIQDCHQGSRVCREEAGGARCVELCEVVRKERSYIGCEYWAVDLDNAFVRGSSPSGYYDAQGRQFAVVVSNVNKDLVARVTISTVDGPVYCAPWEDIPQVEDGAFDYEPDALWCQEDLQRCETQERCTVVVEEVDEDGRTTTREVCTQEGRGMCESEAVVESGHLMVFNLPRRDVNGTIKAPLAFRIQSSIPINAYEFNPLENEQVYSNDASLLLPINALGKYYLIMSREQTFDVLKTYLTVVAVWPGETEVYVTPKVRTLPGQGIPALAPGQRKRFVLQQFDVLNIETNCPSDPRGYCRQADDLTGSEVFANKLVAVFGGSEASNAPNTNHCHKAHPDDETGVCWDGETECRDNADCSRFITCCADHLEQQMFPVDTWGKHYIATKSHDRNQEPDVWRIMAQRDGTVVQTIPHQVDIPVLDRGEYFDFESREHFEIVASSAILVGQYLAAEQAPDPNSRGVPQPGDAGTGDPAFMLAVPVEQYMSSYVVLAPDKYEYDFANVITPRGNVVLHDGEPIPPASFEPVASGEYLVARLRIDDGVHTFESLPGDDGRDGPPIGVLVYGYDQYVSYGYPGGLNLRTINTCRVDSDCPLATVCVDGECVRSRD